jgi:hypothetical protein
MKKLLLIAALLLYTNPAAASLGCPSMSFKATQPLSCTNALTGLSSAVAGTTNATTFQADITSQIAIGTSNVTGYGVPQDEFQAGYYPMSSALTNVQPWTKIKSQGPMELDFATLGTSSVAISINNDLAPTGAFTLRDNSENDGPVINGTNGNILINGPLSAGNTNINSVGLLIGSGTTSPNANLTNLRQTGLSHFQVQNFGIGIKEAPYNYYMVNYDHLQLIYNNYGISTTNVYAGVNAGEEITYTVGDCSQNNYCLFDNTTGIDRTFDKFSFDANAIAIFHGTANAQFSKQSIINSHLEDFSNGTPVASEDCTANVFNNNETYVFDHDKFVWINNNTEVPFNHFQGCAFWTFTNNYIVGYGATDNSAALTAMYMFGAGGILLNHTGNSFQQNVVQKQLLAAQVNVIDDPTFSTGVNGGNFQSTPSNLPTWTVETGTACSGLTPTVDTSTTWTAGSGVASMKFTYSAASQTCFVDSDKIPVQAGDHLLADIIVNGGTSTGTGTKVNMYFNWVPCNSAIATTTDVGAEVSDDFNTIYGGGARTTAAKMFTLLEDYVPQGICFAQLVVNPTGVPSGKSIWILDAEVDKI